MRNVLLTLVVGFCIASIAGCGPREEPAVPAPADPTAPVPVDPAAPPPVEPVPDVPEVPPAEEPDDPAVDEDVEGLAGTTWQLDEYVVEFQDDRRVLVKGGQIATLMPDGAMGEYKVEDGKFSISILGMSLDGSWDGQTLIVNDTEAIPQ